MDYKTFILNSILEKNHVDIDHHMLLRHFHNLSRKTNKKNKYISNSYLKRTTCHSHSSSSWQNVNFFVGSLFFF